MLTPFLAISFILLALAALAFALCRAAAEADRAMPSDAVEYRAVLVAEYGDDGRVRVEYADEAPQVARERARRMVEMARSN